MSESWDRCDGEDYRDEESDFGEDPFGEYDIEYQFQDEPSKPAETEIVRNLMFKPNPKLWKDKRK